MQTLSASFKNFLLLYLGACMVLAGVLGFFAMHDQDWKYSFDRQSDRPPRHEGPVHYYSTLPEEQRGVVDGAIAGEVYHLENAEDVPPGVVEYNGTYLVFDRFTVFDWIDPGTAGPLGVAGAGVVMVVYAIRRDFEGG